MFMMAWHIACLNIITSHIKNGSTTHTDNPEKNEDETDEKHTRNGKTEKPKKGKVEKNTSNKDWRKVMKFSILESCEFQKYTHNMTVAGEWGRIRKKILLQRGMKRELLGVDGKERG